MLEEIPWWPGSKVVRREPKKNLVNPYAERERGFCRLVQEAQQIDTVSLYMYVYVFPVILRTLNFVLPIYLGSRMFPETGIILD